MTTKQAQAVAKMVENGGNVGKAMREAGYSEAMVKNPQKLMRSKAVKNQLAPLLKKHNLNLDRYLSVIADAQQATKIVTSHTEPDYAVADHAIRLSANKQAREFLDLEEKTTSINPELSKALNDNYDEVQLVRLMKN